jgi:cysteine desulfurase/selenocysteine lyase
MREYFPFFKNHPDLIYLDTAATSQTLYSVIGDQVEFLTNRKSNAHRSGHSMGTWVDTQYYLAKQLTAKWLNIANPNDQIIFNSGSSQGLADAVTLISESMSGGTIFLGLDSHHSLLLPILKLVDNNPQWNVQYIDVDQSGLLDLAALAALLKKSSDKNKVIAVTAISNVLGKINNLDKIQKLADKHGAVTVIDASQIIGKRKFDASGFDFVAWSWHKVYGPTGLGCLVIKNKWVTCEPVRPGGGSVTDVKYNSRTWINTAQRFESGTQNLQAIVSVPSLVEWLMAHEADITSHDIAMSTHVKKLLKDLPFKVAAMPDSGLVSLLPGKMTAEDFVMMLDSKKVMCRAGKLCAQPLVDSISQNKSLLRFSWGAYSNKEEVSRALDLMVKINDKF